MNGLSLISVCLPSTDVVAREIEDDIVIVPISSGFGDAGDELYALNETGRAIWRLLDGERSLVEVVQTLTPEYEGPPGQVETDVLGFVGELVERGILIVQG